MNIVFLTTICVDNRIEDQVIFYNYTDAVQFALKNEAKYGVKCMTHIDKKVVR